MKNDKELIAEAYMSMLKEDAKSYISVEVTMSRGEVFIDNTTMVRADSLASAWQRVHNKYARDPSMGMSPDDEYANINMKQIPAFKDSMEGPWPANGDEVAKVAYFWVNEELMVLVYPEDYSMIDEEIARHIEANI